MFPLINNSVPATRDELVEAVKQSLATVLKMPPGFAPVSVEGAYPDLSSFDVILDQSIVSIHQPPPKPAKIIEESSGFTAGRFQLFGNPLLVEDAHIRLQLQAERASFSYGRDAQGQLWILVAKVDSGDLRIEANLDELERAITHLADTAARTKGASVESVSIQLESESAGASSFQLSVKAKKGFMGTTVHVKGRLLLDRQLNATLSQLQADADGMVGKMLLGFIRPKVEAAEGKSFSLTALPLAGMTLRDAALRTEGRNVHVTAAFGAAEV